MRWLLALAVVLVNGQNYALIRVTPTDGSDDALKVCVAYGQDFRSDPYVTLPEDPYHSDLTLSFSDLTDQSNLALCKNNTDNNSLPIQGANTALVSRGECTFQEKATTFKEISQSGSGLITINNNDSLFSPIKSDNNSSQLDMFVAIMANSTFYQLKSFAEEHNGFTGVRGAVYALPKESKFDPTLIAVWLLAMVCVTIGTLLAGQEGLGNALHDLRRSSSTSLDAKVLNDAAEVEYEDQPQITAKTGFIWLCVTAGWLMILYWLYDYLVYVMIGIFCFCGALAMGHVLYCAVLSRFSCTMRYTVKECHYRIPFCDFIPRYLCRGGQPIAALVLYACCFAFSITWFCLRHSSVGWIFQDVIGFFFCVYTITELRLPNFKVLCYLLVGFAIYDLFMVYVTPYLTPSKQSVMVYVATGGDNKEKMPFLFLMPHLSKSELVDLCHLETGFSMLGFGDLIIPGFLGGYAVYFDVFNEHKRYYYWWTFIISYGCGLILTFLALYVMNSGQPALVFIVPSTLGALIFCAIIRRELAHFWNGPKVKESTN